ncbi:MFS transporter [Calidifontibacter terrae]
MSRRPFVGLVIAEACSVTGSRLAQIAVPWLVLTLTGSATWTGAAGFVEMLPYVVGKALGGPIIDRIGAKRVAVWCDSMSVPLIGAIPLVHATGHLGLPLISFIAALVGTVRGPADGAKSALVPAVARDGGLPLERVTGVLGTVERLGSSLGAAFAGALIAAIGAAPALALDAVALALSALLVARTVPAAEPATTHEPYAAALRGGWRFLRTDAVLVGISTMVALTNLLDQAYSAVLLPVWARETGHSVGTVGLLFAVWSAASVGGAIIAALTGERLPRLPVYLVAFLFAGLPRFAALGSGAGLPIVLGVLVIGGFASGFINPILSAVVFERIPDHLLGRVSTLNTALCWSLIPFGGLLGGQLINTGGVRSALWVVGVAYFAVTLLPLVHHGFRGFSSRPLAAATPKSA